MVDWRIVLVWGVLTEISATSLSAGGSLPKPSVVYTSQHSALVTWPDVIMDGDQYIVEYGTNFKHSKTLNISRNTNTAMIHGLKQDTLYRVRVKATKAHPGPSIRFRTKPYAVSFVAPAVAVQPKPHNQLLVSWGLPMGTNPSDVVHFHLIYGPLYSPYFMKTTLLLPGNYRKFQLKFLRPDTVYKVKVAALLKTRKGPFSAWVMEKTAESIGIMGQGMKTTMQPPLLLSTQYAQQTTALPTEATTTTQQNTALPTDKTTTTQQNTALPTESTTTTQQNTALPTDKTTTTQQNTALPTEATTATQQNTALPTEATTTTQQNTALPTEATTTTQQNTALPTDKTTTKRQNTALPTDKTTTTRQNTALPNDKTTTQQNTTLPTETTTATQQNTALPTETTTATQQNTALPNEATTTTQQNTALPTDKTTTTRQTTALPNDKTTTQQNTDLPTETTTATQQNTALPTETTTTTQQTTALPSEETTTQQNSNPSQPKTQQETTLQPFEETSTASPSTDGTITNQKITTNVPQNQTTGESLKRTTKQKEAAPPKTPGPLPPKVTYSPVTNTLPTVSESRGKCERILPSMCSDNGYETTKVVFKQNQEEMIKHVESVWSKVSSICGDQDKLKRFICAVNFPYCSLVLGEPLLPCRSMCTVAKNRCNLAEDGIWPAELDCKNFPDVGENMCISFGYDGETPTTGPEMTTNTPTATKGATKETPTQHLVIKTTSDETLQITSENSENGPSRAMTLNTKAVTQQLTKGTTVKTSTGKPTRGAILEPTKSNLQNIRSKISRLLTTDGPLVKPTLSESGGNLPTTTATYYETPTTENQNVVDAGVRVDTDSTAASSSMSLPSLSSSPTDSSSSLNRPSTSQSIPFSPSTSRELKPSSPNTKSSSLPPAEESSSTVSKVSSSPSSPSTIWESSPPTELSSPPTELSFPPTELSSPPTELSSPPTELSSPPTTSRAPSQTVRTPSSERCEPLKLRICASAGYNWVQFPNYFNQTHQNDASRSLVHYWPLVEANCSPYFAQFLCSFYTPICTDVLPRGRGVVKGNILPCRSLCEKVTRQCGTIMRVYEYTWPRGVECNMLPEDGKETCFYPNSDLVKYADPTPKPIQSTDIQQGVNGCQELSFDHVCKKHYIVAALSNISKSFRSVNTAIRNRITLFNNQTSKKCLRNLELFMCSLYTPRCSINYQPMGPCRSQCKTTLRRCISIMTELDYLLPELRNCRQFPLTGCTANKRRVSKQNKKRKFLVETY